jgi:hypothetical protein
VHNYQAPVVLIADINWYSDAALSPDSLAATSREVGLGVFIHNPSARISNSPSLSKLRPCLDSQFFWSFRSIPWFFKIPRYLKERRCLDENNLEFYKLQY